jgi:hypothetical protein
VPGWKNNEFPAFANTRTLLAIALQPSMKKLLFRTSMICSMLVCVFLFTKFSLNGYKTDFYFFIFTLLINLLSLRTLRKADGTKRKSLINLLLAILQIVGLCIFLTSDTIQVDKIYKPSHAKNNLYASLGGFYKRAYFKKHQKGTCDGELWETKFFYYFPIIEIETKRDKCHNVEDNAEYQWLFKHVPE